MPVRPRSDEHGWLHIPLVVGPAHHGYRLDRFLGARIRRLSRTRVQGIIARGHVTRAADGALLLRGSSRVREGEVVILSRPAPQEPAVVMDYDVLHQDSDVLVLDKPSGLPVHPSARYHRHTLTALVRERLGPDHGWELAHRLDRETSGVLVLGRHGGSARVLKRAFRQRTVAKEYLAIVHGRLEESRLIDVPLGPDSSSRVRIKMGFRSVSDGGLHSSTEVEPVAFGSFRGRGVTLVRAHPLTGRQHQIRVHLALIGHGIVGDKLYGIDEQWFIDVAENGRPMSELDAELGLHRQALHARRIGLTHPGTGALRTFVAPWPAELSRIVPFEPTEFARSLRQPLRA